MTLLMLLFACRGSTIPETQPATEPDTGPSDTAVPWAPGSAGSDATGSEFDACSCDLDLWRASDCGAETRLLAVCLVDSQCNTSSFDPWPWETSPSIEASPSMAVRWEFDGPVRSVDLNGPPSVEGDLITRPLGLYVLPSLNGGAAGAFAAEWERAGTVRLTEGNSVLTVAISTPPSAGEVVRSTMQWSSLLASGGCIGSGYSASWDID